jgi:phosphatidylinositol 4-kinase
VRLASATLLGLAETNSHPLAREFHFHVILFSLKVLRYSTSVNQSSLWQLKDQILSAALNWFQHPPRWSFGGNRLQIKAEAQLLHDVEVALQSVSQWGMKATSTRKSLQARQDLLLLLLESERSRLMVWLYPLDHESRHPLSSGASKQPSEVKQYSNLSPPSTYNSRLPSCPLRERHGPKTHHWLLT